MVMEEYDAGQPQAFLFDKHNPIIFEREFFVD